MRRVIILLIITANCGLTSYSQDTLKTKRVKVLPVPALGYSPETRTYIGAVALFTLNLYDDSLTRSSNAKIEFNYSFNKQIIIETGWNYFTKEEKWFTQGSIHYSKYPDLYFGIGANSLPEDQVSFQSNRIKFDIGAYKNISRKWFLGLEFRHFNYFNFKYSQDSIVYPELKNEDRTGLGWAIFNDKRDNLLTPTTGSYFKFSNNYNFGSTFYSQINLDFRKYFTFGKKIKQTISSRFLTKHTIGEAPFYDIALIGGDQFIRGYFYGRFREDNLSTIQFEYRASLFWRIGLSAFGGTTLIYQDFDNLTGYNLKPNAGVGLRFLVDKEEGTNLRFDYAVGANGESGFYVSFGESF